MNYVDHVLERSIYGGQMIDYFEIKQRIMDRYDIEELIEALDIEVEDVVDCMSDRVIAKLEELEI